VAGVKVGAVVGLDEGLEGMDAGEQADEIVFAAECEDRVDQIVADAGFALLDLEAVGEEVWQRLINEVRITLQIELLPLHVRGLISVRLRVGHPHHTSGVRSIPNRESQSVREDKSDHTKGRTPKGKGILRSSRPLINREERSKRIKLIRQTYRHRHRRGGDFIALPDRL